MSEKSAGRTWERLLLLGAVVALCAALAMMFGVGTAHAEAVPHLNKASVTVTAGKTATLKVTGAKSTVKWSSSKKSVVTVKASGKYKARATLVGKRAGTATVHAKVGKKVLKAKVKVRAAGKKAGGNSNDASGAGNPGAAAAPADSRQGRDQQPRTSESKTIVVYWSGTGNTRRVANIIAKHLNVTAYELQPAEPYTAADLNFNDSNSRVVREYANGARTIRPALAESVPNWSSYDTVYLGYPIWWGQAPNLLYTFAEGTDFSGKTVIPFCSSLSSPISDSATNLQRAAHDTGAWRAGHRFGENASERSITSWVDSQQ